MRSCTHSSVWTRGAVATDDVATNRPTIAARRVRAARSRAAMRECRPSSSGGLSASLRLVGVLAFCQVIFFLVLFLFVCARAGAATVSKAERGSNLTLSTYATQTARDPFGSEAVGSVETNGVTPAASVDAGALKVTGILYDAAHPSALINNQLVELNRPVRMPTAQGEVEVKAVTITRERVVLQVGSQTVELQFGGGEHN